MVVVYHVQYYLDHYLLADTRFLHTHRASMDLISLSGDRYGETFDVIVCAPSFGPLMILMN